MAPSVAQTPVPIVTPKLRTSGQLDPIYELIRPFEEFPKEVTGRTVWKAEDYKDAPEKWTHRWTEDQLAAINKAADDFIAAKHRLTAITKVCCRSHAEHGDWR